MSGTSLDGLDISYCNFQVSNKNKWDFKTIYHTTLSFSKELKEKLINAKEFSGLDLMLLNNEFGNFIGNSINHFMEKNSISKKEVDLISSHGHTIFHQPDLNLTTQIGSGANISAITQLPVVCDFRTTDISLGGQGAPLVPIGDQLLFSDFDYCINLGGIANVSFLQNKQPIAFDICPVNIVLNSLANQLDKDYDKGGELAKQGNINTLLLQELNQLDYYLLPHPKSLGAEWIETAVFPIIHSFDISIPDKLRTFVEHIAIQIANIIQKSDKSILVTGGGTFNSFLIDTLKSKLSNQLIIPSQEIIEYKEAIIFAFLGVLRLRQEPNCLSSVTGAAIDNIGGCIYQAR